jgi:hypothetical protein
VRPRHFVFFFFFLRKIGKIHLIKSESIPLQVGEGDSWRGRIIPMATLTGAAAEGLASPQRNKASTLSRLQCIVPSELERAFTPHEIVQMRAQFKLFDTSGDGSIDKWELANVLTSLGEHPTEDDLEKIIKQVDKNDDGEIQVGNEVGSSSPSHEVNDDAHSHHFCPTAAYENSLMSSATCGTW